MTLRKEMCAGGEKSNVLRGRDGTHRTTQDSMCHAAFLGSVLKGAGA